MDQNKTTEVAEATEDTRTFLLVNTTRDMNARVNRAAVPMSKRTLLLIGKDNRRLNRGQALTVHVPWIRENTEELVRLVTQRLVRLQTMYRADVDVRTLEVIGAAPTYANTAPDFPLDSVSRDRPGPMVNIPQFMGGITADELQRMKPETLRAAEEEHAMKMAALTNPEVVPPEFDLMGAPADADETADEDVPAGSAEVSEEAPELARAFEEMSRPAHAPALGAPTKPAVQSAQTVNDKNLRRKNRR